jgi:Tfp pilus assembly protein PilO
MNLMNTSTPIKKAFRTPSVYIPILVAIVVLIVWMFGLFLPQGSKLSKLNAQEQTLQQKQQDLQAELARLRKINPVALTRLHNQYSIAIPSSIDNTGYLNQINGAMAAAGVKLVSFTPGVAGASSAETVAGVTPIPVSLITSGTYDQELSLMQLLYKLPRLTTISSIQVTGGGPGMNRASPLTMTMLMTIYEAPPVPGTPASSTSSVTP